MLKECWINVYRCYHDYSSIRYGYCWESKEVASMMLDKFMSQGYRIHVKMKEQQIAEN